MAQNTGTIPEVILVPRGRFLMGSPAGSDDERPVHEVQLSGFSIGKYAIRNCEYDSFLKATGHPAPPLWEEARFKNPDQPVVSIRWFDAISYCDWLSKTTGQRWRLPTEAEWEYAACSGDPANTYPWGSRGWQELPDFHHCFSNGPQPAGRFEPNAFGIHDMGINVHEWCSDWYDAEYYAASPSENPTGPTNGTRRASRGGSWRHLIKITRCAARSSIPPASQYADYGFRVVSA